MSFSRHDGDEHTADVGAFAELLKRHVNLNWDNDAAPSYGHVGLSTRYTTATISC